MAIRKIHVLVLGCHFLPLPLMKAIHIVEPNIKGRKYILAMVRLWQGRGEALEPIFQSTTKKVKR